MNQEPEDRRPVSRRQLLVGTAATLGTAAFALAGPAGVAQASSAATVEQLRFWHLLTGGDGINMNSMVRHTNRSQSSYQATQTILAWGTPYYTKLAMASAGGRAPDVAIMHESRIAGYAPGGLLDPWDLDRLARHGIHADDFPTSVWRSGQSGGKQFAVALDSHPFIMMYNPKILKKAGVLGSDGQIEQTSSPEEFIELAGAVAKVTGKHGLSYGYLGDGGQMWRLFYTFYKQCGADMVLRPGAKAEVDMDAAVKSLEFITKLLDDTITAANGDYGTAISEFLGGGSGLLFTGVWELPTMKANKLAVDACPIPNLFGTPAAYADSHAFVLPHQSRVDSQKRDDAYAFVAAMLKDSLLWANGGHIPAYQPVATSRKYLALEPQAHYASAAQHLNYDPTAWFTGSGSDFQNYFLGDVQDVFRGTTSPKSGMEAFVKRLNVLLAKPNPVG
jgi:multiple sugar transport system substrate-binding protein